MTPKHDLYYDKRNCYRPSVKESYYEDVNIELGRQNKIFQLMRTMDGKRFLLFLGFLRQHDGVVLIEKDDPPATYEMRKGGKI